MRAAALFLTAALIAISCPALAQRGAEGGEAAARALPEPAIPIKPKAANVAGFLDCIVEQRATIISAHRGGPKPGYPENAIETFAYTLSKIPALIELDVAQTEDGVLVLMHDSELGRTSTGRGRISEKSLKELRAESLRDPTGFAPQPPMRIPTLEEALIWAKDRAVVQIDLKRGVDVADVVELVQRHGAQRYAAIIVDDVEEAAKVVSLDPTISMSVGITRPDMLDRLVEAGVPEDRIFAFTGVNREDPALWDLLERRGIPAIFATLWAGDRDIAASNNEAKYARLADSGVDILVTDRHFDAYWAMEKRQDIEAAVKACVRP
ncbi:glycerophosphodiester phosphodiesterase family protein [Indioceanicola profundi]|uniref:glycerophosphodiester phosphodiesterase family protein n=1 Tax=Indioceanicola profundi TaxID=2220096 RepID=UPI000E6AC8E2|nr:glycerophosphodiester phosphodiesterase family protein [Indioceanicola profundi]